LSLYTVTGAKKHQRTSDHLGLSIVVRVHGNDRRDNCMVIYKSTKKSLWMFMCKPYCWYRCICLFH